MTIKSGYLVSAFLPPSLLHQRMSNTSENITLGEVAEIKRESVESIQTYLAGQGVAIPADSNYALSATELKAIDPILAFNLKYGVQKPKSAIKRSEPKSGNLVDRGSEGPVHWPCLVNQRTCPSDPRDRLLIRSSYYKLKSFIAFLHVTCSYCS